MCTSFNKIAATIKKSKNKLPVLNDKGQTDEATADDAFILLFKTNYFRVNEFVIFDMTICKGRPSYYLHLFNFLRFNFNFISLIAHEISVPMLS